MPIEHVDTLVVGGGQAGLAMSAHLSANSVPHLVLERDRVAESWRTGRWDSLVANGPAWHDRFPILEFAGDDPDGFPGKDRIAGYFEELARLIEAPVRCGVEVLRATRNGGRPGFRVETSEGELEAVRIVAATGPFQTPVIPPVVPADAGVTQLHSAAYRSPGQLPDGAVLVVGSGSSGAQIADELMAAGRKVYLSVSPHRRPPRGYRERDYCWWLGVLGKWDEATPERGGGHVTIAVSGANGGRTVDFREMAARGAMLVGMSTRFADGRMHFAADLAENIAAGDADYLRLLDEADAYAARNGLDLPEEPEARRIGPDPGCLTDPLRYLDLAEAGIGAILWATGYALDFGWLQVDSFDGNGQPRHQRGVSSEPGVYFLGLPWLSRRGSSFIWGVWHDARYLADLISIQRNYLEYRPASGQAA